MAGRLHDRYKAEVIPALTKQFEYGNPNQVPKLTKIVINIGLGEALTNAKALDAAVGDLSMITGQKPTVTRALGATSPPAPSTAGLTIWGSTAAPAAMAAPPPIP